VNNEISMPEELYKKHKQIDLCFNTIYVNGMGFLTGMGYLIYY